MKMIKPAQLLPNNLLMLLSIIAVTFLASCGDDDGDDDIKPATNTAAADVTLSDLNRGEGAVNVTGDETLSLTPDGTLVSSSLKSTINDIEYEILRISLSDQVGSENLSVSLSFYIPNSLNRTSPPDGTFSVGSQSAGLDQTYVVIFVSGADDTYSSLSTTTGTVTVLNTESEEYPYKFDIVFDVQNLTSFDDTAVGVQGAIKWGL